jgi:hypothetical protein
MGRLQSGVYSTGESAHVLENIIAREKNFLKEAIYFFGFCL